MCYVVCGRERYAIWKGIYVFVIKIVLFCEHIEAKIWKLIKYFLEPFDNYEIYIAGSILPLENKN